MTDIPSRSTDTDPIARADLLASLDAQQDSVLAELDLLDQRVLATILAAGPVRAAAVILPVPQATTSGSQLPRREAA